MPLGLQVLSAPKIIDKGRISIDISKIRVSTGFDNKIYIWLDMGDDAPPEERWESVGLEAATAIHIAAMVTEEAMLVLMEEQKGRMSH